MTTSGSACLVLRLAGPLQSWGSRSQFNRRDTDNQPTKSGVIGLLAAADGRVRSDPIVDLVDLSLGVRVDLEGSLLRDYHTVSDHRGVPLLSAAVDSKGRQKRTAPAKYTGVTQRFYLQDAVFVAALAGDRALLEGLAEAVTRPGFPLALGRRSCVPTQPVLLTNPAGDGPLWSGSARDVLAEVPWQVAAQRRAALVRARGLGDSVALMGTVENPAGEDVVQDVPVSFSPERRGFAVRRVDHVFFRVPTGEQGKPSGHDPMHLLGPTS